MNNNDLNVYEKVQVPIKWRDPILLITLSICNLFLLLFSTGYSTFSLIGGSFTIPLPQEFTVPAKFSIGILILISCLITIYAVYKAIKRQNIHSIFLFIVGFCFISAFLIWVVSDQPQHKIPLIRLLSGTLIYAVPLAMGALSGVICERSGIINIAIEGQLIFGSFVAIITASFFQVAWVGLLTAPIAGIFVSILLALFTIKYRCNHIVVGVVLNMLFYGLTSFLYSAWLKPNERTLNTPMELATIKIPFLSDIPVIGPILFNNNILVYIMIISVITLNIFLFNSKWGLRTRACGEHPKAADTVGIKVNRLRFKNVLLAGAIAGLGGSFYTIGNGLSFSKIITAGNGFIALAAMILGGWRPTGALFAALLFSFATSLGYTMQTIESPFSHEFLLMLPYIATILAVSGFVGSVNPPAAEGEPYP